MYIRVFLFCVLRQLEGFYRVRLLRIRLHQSGSGTGVLLGMLQIKDPQSINIKDSDTKFSNTIHVMHLLLTSTQGIIHDIFPKLI